jgi:hypothetical protein
MAFTEMEYKVFFILCDHNKVVSTSIKQITNVTKLLLCIYIMFAMYERSQLSSYSTWNIL